MAEEKDGKKVYSLLEITKSIKSVLERTYSQSYWVKAEMNKLNYYKQSGHCYPDLVEKEDGKVIAQMRSHLWKSDYNRINQNFLSVLKEPLKEGIKILFRAMISFDPVHGLALHITDIDPNFTLGDLEREKQATIQRLKTEGIYNQNKQLPLPLLPQRIAIISVETSKGYADFLEVIGKNPWGYNFFHLLFPSLLQGDQAASQIIGRLRQIKKVISHFDVVAIIRGGGGDIGLTCYNDYRLSKEIATFPIPVLTGIGHSTNETVAEMVAYDNSITPTKLAEYLIQKFHNFSIPVKDAVKSLKNKTNQTIKDERLMLQAKTLLFRSETLKIVTGQKSELRLSSQKLAQQSRYIFSNEKNNIQSFRFGVQKGTALLIRESDRQTGLLGTSLQRSAYTHIGRNQLILSQHKSVLDLQTRYKIKDCRSELENAEKNIQNMSPVNVLRRGYSITLLSGKALKDCSSLKTGDQIETKLFNGTITSIVSATKQGEDG